MKLKNTSKANAHIESIKRERPPPGVSRLEGVLNPASRLHWPRLSGLSGLYANQAPQRGASSTLRRPQAG
ncbi:hypothetical protein [[Eubacterium] cellulosolvens]